MTLNLSFLLLVSLLTTSGLVLCATYDQSPVDVTIHLDTKFPDEEGVKGRDIKDRGVGIHLGMTHSSVAVFKHPRPPEVFCHGWNQKCSESSYSDIFQVVLNEHGSRTTPSCVAFTDSGVLIGESAKDQAAANSERTICGINSLIGKRFDDPDVQSYIKTLPYKVVNKENKAHVQVNFKDGENKVFSPEEICAMILGKMKDLAEAYMGNKIEFAVVLLHDSLFDKVDRTIIQASIMEAGKMVGLVNIHVTTSRLASVLTLPLGNERVLVYNLGGGAFDVSLQERDEIDLFEVVASRGDAHLGGQTFDMRVADYFVNLIKSKYNRDISKDLRALRKLQIECEKAKISLSSRDRVMIKMESLADGIMLFEEPLTRKTFEELNMDLFNKTIDLVKSVLNEGDRIKKRHFDGIILVGGNARIPKIQHMLKEEFASIEPLKDVNTDEALAYAATHLAGKICGRDEGFFRGVATYESLGVFVMPYAKKLVAGILPAYYFQNIKLNLFGQNTVVINVFEGETPLTKDCRSLGKFQIYYPISTSGEVIIEVKLEVDVNADVRLTIEHGGSPKITSINIPAEQVLYRRKDLQSILRGRNESLGSSENAYCAIE